MMRPSLRLALCFATSIALHIALVAGGFSAMDSTSPKGMPRRYARFAAELSAIERDRGHTASDVDKQLEPITTGKTALSSYSPNKPSTEAQTRPNPIIDNYLPARLLTHVPNPIDSVEIAPIGFNLHQLLGEIELMLLISSEGQIDDVILIRSSLPAPLVDLATSAFKNARFVPGRVNETAVRSRVRVIISPDAFDFDSQSLPAPGTRYLPHEHEEQKPHSLP